MGKEVHMFWDAEKSAAHNTGYEPNVLPLAVMVPGRHSRDMTIVLPTNVPQPQRVTARLMMRPVGMDILNDLVASQDLDPEILKRMPTFPLHGTHIEWTKADGPNAVTDVLSPPVKCPDDYLKLLP
jgi:hypothetical protein